MKVVESDFTEMLKNDVKQGTLRSVGFCVLWPLA